MLRRLWLVVLVAGLAVTAHPVGSRIKRVWLQWKAATIWDNCKGAPATGATGEPVLWLDIPSVGISQLVVEGQDGETLSRFPGRADAGRATLIMAHRDTHFRGLADIREGNSLQLETRIGTLRSYRIQAIHICDKQEVVAFLQSHVDEDCLLLLTCYPFRYIGPAPERFVVLAEPVEVQ